MGAIPDCVQSVGMSVCCALGGNPRNSSDILYRQVSALRNLFLPSVIPTDVEASRFLTSQDAVLSPSTQEKTG